MGTVDCKESSIPRSGTLICPLNRQTSSQTSLILELPHVEHFVEVNEAQEALWGHIHILPHASATARTLAHWQPAFLRSPQSIQGCLMKMTHGPNVFPSKPPQKPIQIRRGTLVVEVTEISSESLETAREGIESTLVLLAAIQPPKRNSHGFNGKCCSLELLHP